MDPDRTRFVYSLKRKLRSSHSEDLLQNAAHVGGYSLVAAGLLFVMHIVLARMLGPEQYAIYGTYLSILLTVFIAFSSIHLIITRFVNYHDSRHQFEQITYLIKKSFKILFGLGFVLFALMAFFSPQISAFFQIPSAAPTVWLGLVLWFAILTPIFEGAFKGLGILKPLGWMRLYESGFRVLFVILLVYVGFGVSGAVAGLGLGTIVGLALSYRHILKAQTKKVIAPNFARIQRFALPVVVTMVSFAILLNLDILVAKHFFAPAQAGVFAAASILAKAPVFLALVVIMLLYPKVTHLHAHGKNSSQLLRHALLILSSIMAVFTLAGIFFAESLVYALFGAQYSIGLILGFYVFAMSAAALAVVLITYLLAISKESVAFAMPLFVIVLAAILAVFHQNMFQIMIGVMFVMTLLCAYAVYMAREYLEFDYFL